MKKILFAVSECVPFIKTGGLADVAGSLPKELDKNNYDVRVVMPEYECIPYQYREKMEYIMSFYIDIANHRQYVGIKRLIYEGVTYYFVDNQYYFSGQKPYGDMYQDIEKFAFFSKAIFDVTRAMQFQPDIIHCHDWQTGLIPVFLRTFYRNDPYFRDTKSIITIHNLQYQGICDFKKLVDVAGLPAWLNTPDKLEIKGDASVLKGGIVYADYITTVSDTYAQEIQYPYFGEGLDGLLRARHFDLVGVVNGIDYDIYNPEKDNYIVQKYSVKNFKRNKVKNKIALQQELGLPVDGNKFMVGMISRLTNQKGLDLVNHIMNDLCRLGDMQIVILGTGDQEYEEIFRNYEWNNKHCVSSSICYSNERSHKIYASCDAFMMPSRFEPCGLSQLMALRYGTVPIVRETGGLKDTVEPYNEFEQTGTGFTFANYNAHELLHAIEVAKYVYYTDREAWNEIVKRGMKADFSWKKSAYKYQGIYDYVCR